MEDCHVCGRRFDPLGFQIVVPELGCGFDRIECAGSARALAVPESRIATTPLVAVVEPIGPLASAGGRTIALRPLAAPAATLGLLAAGTAAAVLLWLRVLGTETAAFPLSLAQTPPALGQETVEAYVPPAPETGPASVVRSPSEHRAPDSVTSFLAAGRQSADGSPGRTATRRDGTGHSGATRPTARTTPEPIKTTGKDHVKRGNGHYKHGETDGVHTPGHGRAHGGHGHQGHRRGH